VLEPTNCLGRGGGQRGFCGANQEVRNDGSPMSRLNDSQKGGKKKIPVKGTSHKKKAFLKKKRPGTKKSLCNVE